MRSEYESMKLVPKVTLRELITNNALRIPLIISLVIMIAQQLSGINAVRYTNKIILKICDINFCLNTGDVLLNRNFQNGRPF